jgi:hypothetical protein
VSHAIALESERLMDDGHNNPESFLQAETLREAWKRVLRG